MVQLRGLVEPVPWDLKIRGEVERTQGSQQMPWTPSRGTGPNPGLRDSTLCV